jgi:DNA modification methylase
MSEEETKIPKIKKPRLDHLNRQIPPQAHTPMYNWHKFWARKTWNVVAGFIKNYSSKNDVVFDPFAGSGVVALEALRNGRRAIVSDILPIATEIIRLTIKPVSETKLYDAYRKVEEKVKNKIESLYLTKCRKCGCEFPFTCAIWEKGKLKEIRYDSCPKCGDRKEKKCILNSYDKKLLKKIERSKIKEWYPNQKLYHVNGQPFMKKEKYESLDELFTKRNLQALAWLMEAIEEEKDKTLQDFLKIGFTSMVHLCSRMLPDRPTRPFSSVWSEHSYWYAPRFMEQNVWQKFESAIVGKQGLIECKKESNEYFQEVKIAQNYEQVLNKEADVFIYTGSCFDLMENMIKNYEDKGCVDYIFTDPPYDASVQYGELAYLWVAWLKKDKGYLEKLSSDEVVRNERQQKTFDVYHSWLRRSFEDMYKVLKPDGYLTVTFHNPTFKVRNATIRAGVFAGFEFQKIHHQELARPSAKSLLQPFGSAQGDFYLRFYKLPSGEEVGIPKEIDEHRFERIVVDTAIDVLADRGEPTPYTIIINAVDPELARHGYFSELHTGFDVNTVLKKHLDNEFILVPVKLGGSEGKLWWFKDTSIVPKLQSVPLSERVEQTVLRKLQQRGKVTFTEVWEAISTQFPNSRTSDSVSIKEALKAYAKPVSGGFWLIKPSAYKQEIERLHSIIMTTLAKIGKAQGYKIGIGKIEQSHKIMGFPKESGELRKFHSLSSLTRIKNIKKNPSIVADIDLLWVKNNEVFCSFEVEATTQMTEALNRGSNLDENVPKFLIIPQEREAQLFRKMKSPLFAERYKSDNWKVIFAEKLLDEYSRKRNNLNIFGLVEKKIENRIRKKENKDQLRLFGTS